MLKIRVRVVCKMSVQFILIFYCFCLLMFISGHTTTSYGYNSSASSETENSTLPTVYMSAIFLQTTAAQGIAGAFALVSILLTSYHASIFSCINASL